MRDILDSSLFVQPGGNKFGMTVCPFCRSCGNISKIENKFTLFMFRDALSAREYQISGLCQECQDKTFVELRDDEAPGL
jgi:hypothetical protein